MTTTTETETQNGFPVLNYDLLYDLIKWASIEEEMTMQARAEAKERAKARGLFGTWDQGEWGFVGERGVKTDLEAFTRKDVCGTAFCQAGAAVVMSDYRMIFLDDDATDVVRHVSASECVKIEPTGKVDHKGRALYRDVPGAPLVNISVEAQEILGLTDEEADQYFSGSNGLEELREYANGFCNVRGLPIMFPLSDIYDFDD